MKRKYSIVTVTYNNAHGLRRTLDSIRALKDASYEVIIVDGKSSDDTPAVIDANKDIITRCVSEKDNGVYDAMNKGIRMAMGDYVVFMNAGDCFASADTLSVVDALDGDIILGSAAYGDDSRIIPEVMSLYDVLSIGINHQSAYYRRDIISRYPFDLKYRIIADMKSVVEPMAREKIAVTCTPKVLSVCEGGGMSKRQWREIKTERDAIVAEVVEPFYRSDYQRMVRLDNSMIGNFAVLSQFKVFFPVLKLLTRIALVYNKYFKKIPL